MDRMVAPRAPHGFGLVEILVVVAVVLILAAVLLPRYVGGKRPEEKIKTVRAPITLAQDTVCEANLRIVRQSLEVRRTGDPDGANVWSLAELRELPSEARRCPVGGEEYIYDPQTGQVRCPHPGHQNF
ncbi:MAG TPA: prepilin-type N-terminal cleavage/methylation domain-containing protein [Chthonomonadales bacterium]|nr:prepilin-type N-terminal cleavage/methylation domain-containing protein [Chthonomonadales bacterium]